jgi:3-oxoacyl-[acyl-carrier protein] reductase
MELKGCAAIVTGGSGGLGQRICRALALNGVDVVVN